MTRYLSPRRRRLARLRWVTGALVVLAVALAITVVALIAAVDRNLLRDRIAARLSDALDRTVRIDGDVDVRPGLEPVIVLHDASLANIDGGSRPEMARFGTVELEVALWPLLRGEPAVERVLLGDGDVLLERRADGTPNWRLGGGGGGDDGGGDDGGGTTGFNALRARDVVVTYAAADGGARRVTIEDGLLAGTSPTAPATLTVDGSLEDLPLQVEGRPGSVDAVLGVRVGAAVDLDMRLGDARLSVAGTVDRPFAPATFQLAVDFEAPSLAPVATATGADLPGWSPVALGARASLDRATLRLADLTATIGPTAVGGDLAVDAGGSRPAVSGSLNTDLLDVGAILAGLGSSQGDAGGGTGGMPTGDAGGVPAVPLDFGVLTRFDADLRLRAERVPMGAATLEGAQARLTVSDGDGRLRLDRAALAGGTVDGVLTAGAGANPPALGLELSAAAVDLGGLLAAYGVTDRLAGAADLELRLDGAGSDLRAVVAGAGGTIALAAGETRYDVVTPGPITGALLEALLPSFDGDTVTLRCAALRMPVRDGVASGGRMLVAMQEATIAGRGRLELARLAFELLVEAELQEATGASLLPPIRLHGPLLGPSVETGLSGPSVAIPPLPSDPGGGNACALALDGAAR